MQHVLIMSGINPIPIKMEIDNPLSAQYIRGHTAIIYVYLKSADSFQKGLTLVDCQVNTVVLVTFLRPMTSSFLAPCPIEFDRGGGGQFLNYLLNKQKPTLFYCLIDSPVL